MLTELGVMTFNLRRGTKDKGRHAWVSRLPLVHDVIERYDPDILGTQEGLLSQIRAVSDGVSDYNWIGTPRKGDDGDEHCAIFYKPDKFRLLDHGDFWLSDTPDVPGSCTWGNYRPRMVTWARLKERDTGRDLEFWNTHMDHFAPKARRLGARLIHERLPADHPVVLVGDFNALPHSNAYRFLTTRAREGPGLRDAWRWARHARPARWPATFHNFTGRGLYRIDYIFVNDTVRVDHAETVRHHADGRYPSDHFPVYAQLALAS